MRKNYPALLLICFAVYFSPALKAQTYYPLLDSSINRWSYATQMLGVAQDDPHMQNCFLPVSDFPTSDPKDYTTNDTIIDSVSYKTLLHESYFSACIFGFIREDTASRRIFFRSVQDTAEYVLYDFSLQPGNTMYLRFPPGNAYQAGTYQLDSIINISVTAGSRRKFFFSNPLFPWQPSFSWVESVGAQTTLVYSETLETGIGTIFSACPGVHHQMSEFLACFSHAGRVYFDTCAFNTVVPYINFGGTMTDSCSYSYFTGAIRERENNIQLRLQPNPANAQVLLEFDLQQAAEITITVSDLAGKRVLWIPAGDKTAAGKSRKEIDLASLRAGIYFIECRTAAGTAREKMVIAR